MNDKPFSILIVDDNNQNLMVLADTLESCDYEIGFAMNGKQALDYIAHEKPDLILLDVMMPEMDGYETCSILKNDPEYKDIPIIFLTAKVETNDIVKGFEAGGADYISKPFNSLELKSRVKTHLGFKRAQDKVRESYKALIEANKQIEDKNVLLNELVKKLDVSSKTDYLTGLFNRRSMIDEIGQEVINSKTNSTTFTLVMADIDFFKNVNDTYGHDNGDFVLKEISNILSNSIRKSDTLSRWGGEEFLILFRNTQIQGCLALTERIRKFINDYVFKMNGVDNKLTMTFGVSEYKLGDNIDELVKRADVALFKGKNSGRNVVIFDESNSV